MPKANFLKSWDVIDDPNNPNDVPANGTFTIEDASGDNVVIHYYGFGSTYPTSQDGYHNTAEDEIVGYFSESRRITMVFPDNGGTPDYDRLEIVVADPQIPDVSVPEIGEWGAEADPG